MKNTLILLLSILFISCSNSPEKLLEKGDKYIENSQLEKAMTTYQKVLQEFPDDTLSQQARYNIAWIYLDSKLDYTNGYESLQFIADNYPELEIGKAAINDMDNFPRWLIDKTKYLRSDDTNNNAIKTVDYLIDNFSEDSIIPEALYLKGNIYLNDRKEYYRAINTYQEVIYKYKGTNYEPMSKFMIGYIYANVQNDLPKAEITYFEFLQEFPEHELVPSVKFELDYLGKQIRDIEDLKSKNN